MTNAPLPVGPLRHTTNAVSAAQDEDGRRLVGLAPWGLERGGRPPQRTGTTTDPRRRAWERGRWRNPRSRSASCGDRIKRAWAREALARERHHRGALFGAHP